MLEPAVGFGTDRREGDDTIARIESSSTSWGASLGAAYVWALDRRTLGHVGVRGARQHWTSKFVNADTAESNEAEATTYEVGPLVGGEFFASSSFSLGLELVVSYSRTTSDSSGQGTLVFPVEQCALRTDGFLLFRVYFWRFDDQSG
jgi:hypothetical protein